MKLHGCFREAEVAGRGLEGAQPIQRWQQLAHRLTLTMPAVLPETLAAAVLTHREIVPFELIGRVRAPTKPDEKPRRSMVRLFLIPSTLSVHSVTRLDFAVARKQTLSERRDRSRLGPRAMCALSLTLR